MIKTLLIDDEPLAIENLRSMLEKYCPELDIADTAGNKTEALEKIYTHRPALVFMDIEMAGHTGFDILQEVKRKNFELIFVTAYSQFALQAIKAEALDYILKPISRVELLQAVEKAGQRIRAQQHTQAETIQKIALPAADGLLFVQPEQICYCTSTGRYTYIHLDDGRKILVTKNLGEFEDELPAQTFVRIHNQHIVNLQHVSRYVRGRGGYVVLGNGVSLGVSSRKKAEFLEKFGKQ
jgi:two-component system, LytTR family, response regulator